MIIKRATLAVAICLSIAIGSFTQQKSVSSTLVASPQLLNLLEDLVVGTTAAETQSIVQTQTSIFLQNTGIPFSYYNQISSLLLTIAEAMRQGNQVDPAAAAALSQLVGLVNVLTGGLGVYPLAQ